MKKPKRAGRNARTNKITPIVVSCLISFFLYQADWLITIENQLHDTESFLIKAPVDSDVVIVEIDHLSLKELERWPWPRRYYAKAIENLVNAGAKNVFLDVDFSSKSNPKNDKILADTLNKIDAGTILMPAFMQYSDSSRNKYLTFIQPNKKFRDHVTAVSVNLNPDRDGLVRRIKLTTEFAGEIVPTAATIFNKYPSKINESLKLNFNISPESFRHISFHNIYSNNFDPESIKGKFIIIGATALELSDQITVPVHQSLAGPVVQAIAIQTLAENRPHIFKKTTTGVLLILSCLPVWLLFSARSWRKSLIILVVADLSLLALSMTLHASNILLLDTIPFILFVTLSYTFAQLAKLDKQLQKIIKQRLTLNRKQATMSQVIQNANEGIILLDENLNITTINTAAEKIFGDFERQLIGTPSTALLPNLEVTEITLHDNNQFETKALYKNKLTVPVEITSNKLELDNGCIYTIFIHDISERIARHEMLTHQATHDSLTNLKNRAYLLDHIDSAIRAHKVEQKTATLIMIDLNNFKDINDTLSHNIGDKLLAILGKRLKTLEQENICVARLGGDEFSVFTDTKYSEQRLIELVNKIQNHISKSIELSDISITIDAAIGIAHIPEHAETADDILIAADVAMYQSKSNKVPFSIYEPLSDYHAKRNLTISNDLKRALDNNQLQLYYQPKVDCKTNTVISLEALIRWQHPTLGLIPPDEFIPIIENSSLIKPVSMFTVETAVTKLKELQDSGIDLSIAVNLSTKLLDDVNLVDDINKVLDKHNISPKYLVLEITESAAMSSHNRTLSNLNKLTDSDIKLSIDDFGTSYASFSYLKQLPATELKIDKLFITDICQDDSDKIITKSIISLAHGLKMQVVAEGVEDKETYDYISKLGCDIAQGYWISKPMPGDNVANWIELWNKGNSFTESQPKSN